MSLTKPRAHQLFDIDYKQSVRVLTDENISLTGGAPAVVDGVTLAANDRVLVIGQSTASQNGLYQVAIVGSGSNGTWNRSQDAVDTGELLAGTIVMVTEGTVYDNTQWKLTSNNPITIGDTPLTWEQNSAFAFGNIAANGTAVLANTVGDTLTLTAGTNIAIVGNASSKSVTIGVTGISLDSISNGTSNVNVVSSSGNVTVGVDGTGNVAVFSSGGLAITGNITGNGSQLTGINIFSTLSVAGQSNVVADSIADTLTLVAGSGIAITTDAETDSIVISTSGTGQIFVDGADFGSVTEIVTQSDDLGLITVAVEAESDLGSIVTSGVFFPDLLVVGDINDFQLFGGTDGQYLGTAGNGILQWQTLDSAPLTGNMAGNINGNAFSIVNLESLQASGNIIGSNLSISENITGGNLSVGTGSITTGSVVNSNANGVGNIGSATTNFNTVFARATSAQYADLAEMYTADAVYESGTVLVFGGNNEVTISSTVCDHRVAGVVSTNPAYIMNSGLTGEYVTTVALTGRVPTKVLGPVCKGDLMVSSANGYAQACNQPLLGSIIGKSLENLIDSEGIIEIVIGVR